MYVSVGMVMNKTITIIGTNTQTHTHRHTHTHERPYEGGYYILEIGLKEKGVVGEFRFCKTEYFTLIFTMTKFEYSKGLCDT